MEATADSLAFTPPPEPAAVRGFVLAVIAHLLLVVALSLGISWDKDTPAVAVEAELWSSLPQEAAPPAPEPQPQPQPVQAPPVVQPPAPPVARQPDIAIEREKKRKEQEAKRREEEEQRRKELEARKKLEEQQRLAEEKKQREEQAKKDKQKKELEAKKLEQLRKEQLARAMALAAGAGSPGSQGTAPVSSGPSASYAARLAALFKRNMHFPVDTIPGNPKVHVNVRVAPGGFILGVQVTQPSGNAAWDDAVVRAIQNTQRIPPDERGRWVTDFPLTWGPKDQ